MTVNDEEKRYVVYVVETIFRPSDNKQSRNSASWHSISKKVGSAQGNNTSVGEMGKYGEVLFPNAKSELELFDCMPEIPTTVPLILADCDGRVTGKLPFETAL